MPQLPNHLLDLNPRQAEAVRFEDGPLLIFAGAGSGKTRVLTHRIANLIYSGKASPHQIFAVTFTNKAAKEMKERVVSLLPNGRSPFWVSTFHSACAKILRNHAEVLDYGLNYVIYDENDSLSALKRVCKGLNIDKETLDPKTVLKIIDRAKNDYHNPDQLREIYSYDKSYADMLFSIYSAYQQELKQSNAMDFGDLICNVINIFKLEKKILGYYQQQFKYLLVDEYQDTNRSQYILIKTLSEKNHNLCVVGDDDQSIYAFRGATIENILNFKHDFPEAHTITLDINYRSTANILEAANKIIVENKKRATKDIRTLNPSGDLITCYTAFDDKTEAKFIVTEIAKLLGRGAKPEEIAIFYRTNAQSRAIEEALLSCGLAYEIYGGFKFYERKEIKDILAYYRLLLNPNDNESFLRIVNTPSRGIGNSSLARLSVYASKNNLSLYAALRRCVELNETFLPLAVLKKFKGFSSLIESLTEQVKRAQLILDNISMPDSERSVVIAELLQKITEESGYTKKLSEEDKADSCSRLENINELIRVAYEFGEESFLHEEHPSFSDFLDRASLSSEIDRDVNSKTNLTKNGRKACISLMTLHLAKGLEFDYVFLTGLEEGLLPHSLSIEENDIEEERRLCYVGVTRAKKTLFITLATHRNRFGRNDHYSGEPSRFLYSIPLELLNQQGQYY